MITANDLEEVLEEEETRHRVRSNMMNGIRETYTIVLTRPAGVSSNYMKRYIKEAIENQPSTLMFNPADLKAVVRRRSIMETEDTGG